jgi:poly-beta-1,6-N-acetyl-D-glucosamine synthase
MRSLETAFWFAFSIVFYAFLGYGLVLYVLVKIKRIFNRNNKAADQSFEPMVTLVIPCFNEADILSGKIANSKQLDYPSDKLKIVFITDGSTDHSGKVLKQYPEIEVLHEFRRGGKTAAENRAMQFVKTPFVIFSDANTMLNKEAVRNIVKHFADDKVGCVSGEKRIISDDADTASATEGIYWKYESVLKKLDSELYSAVGAAGELVAFRTSLYTDMPEDTLLDDFMQSMMMAGAGYKIVYEPEAYALETASSNVKEELKRKVRICAGGWQSINRLSDKVVFSKTPLLYFQYVSHRVLRWTITPFLLLAMILLNMMLAWNGNEFYQMVFVGQILFYIAAAVGYVLENKKLRFKPVFVPYYFCIMNYAVLAGLKRYLSGRQNGAWDKAQRKPVLRISITE